MLAVATRVAVAETWPRILFSFLLEATERTITEPIPFLHQSDKTERRIRMREQSCVETRRGGGLPCRPLPDSYPQALGKGTRRSLAG
jgi:hypothetical protein